MYEIGKRAGIGQATLYRHFPNRSALAATLGGELLDDIEAALDEQAAEPNTFEAAMRTIVGVMTRAPGLIGIIREEEGGAWEETLRKRLVGVLAGLLGDAHDTHQVRADVTVDDVIMCMTMVEAVIGEHATDADRERAAGRALVLVLRALLVPRA